jgi:hypothetical protein
MQHIHSTFESNLRPYDPDTDGDSGMYAPQPEAEPELIDADDITEVTQIGINSPEHNPTFAPIATILSLVPPIIDDLEIVDETMFCLEVQPSPHTKAAKDALFAHFCLLGEANARDILEYDNTRAEALRLRQVSRARGYHPADIVLELKKQGMSLPMACALVTLAMTGGDV